MNIVQSIDNQSNRRCGEKGHVEYNWSENIEELIVQFYFQLVRTKDKNKIENLKNKFRDILLKLNNSNKKSEYVLLLFKLTANCRDIYGKGERDLSYMQLLEWWHYNPKLAYFLFENFIVSSKINHPYGSWKDVKYFCQYVLNTTNNKDHPFINYIVELSNFYLQKDYEKLLNCKKEKTKSLENISLSLAGKWLPREKSKFKWLNKKLANHMFSHYLTTGKTNDSIRKASLKCIIHYNKILVILNEYLDTSQIKMCNGNWRYINFNNVTSKTLHLQKLSFMNKLKKGGTLTNRNDFVDRNECANNFKQYLENSKTSNKKVKGKRCNVYEFVKDAILYANMEETEDILLVKDVINEQWKDNATQNADLKQMIVMSDVSGSMETDNCNPLYNSIGLGIRISEKTHSPYKNRILTFSENPSWVKLEDTMSFCEKVKILKQADWGGTTNIYKAMKLICESLICNNIDPIEVENLTLCILSDMQIDTCLNGGKLNTLHENIKLMFNNAGMETKFHKPYKPPHILFWNLRSTNGFPVSVTQKNVTMVSGYNELLLNAFSEKGMEALKEITPLKMLKDILKNDRYKFLDVALQYD
jgi:hypothetical protein